LSTAREGGRYREGLTWRPPLPSAPQTPLCAPTSNRASSRDPDEAAAARLRLAFGVCEDALGGPCAGLAPARALGVAVAGERAADLGLDRGLGLGFGFALGLAARALGVAVAGGRAADLGLARGLGLGFGFAMGLAARALGVAVAGERAAALGLGRGLGLVFGFAMGLAARALGVAVAGERAADLGLDRGLGLGFGFALGLAANKRWRSEGRPLPGARGLASHARGGLQKVQNRPPNHKTQTLPRQVAPILRRFFGATALHALSHPPAEVLALRFLFRNSSACISWRSHSSSCPRERAKRTPGTPGCNLCSFENNVF
jgi:hypothetical protein